MVLHNSYAQQYALCKATQLAIIFSVLPRFVIMVSVDYLSCVYFVRRSGGEMFIGETAMNEVLLLLVSYFHCFHKRALRVSGRIQRAITAILFLW